MAKRIRNLHRPVEVQCDGETYRLLTIGFLTDATGRTSRTIKRWQALGWFPKPVFFLYPGEGPAQRGLYLESFVDELRQIVAEGHLGRRLDCLYRDRFVDSVWRAHEWAMEPLRGAKLSLVEPE